MSRVALGASRSAPRVAVALWALVLCAGCDALEQPPDHKPVPREFASPTLTLGRRPLATASAAPSEAATRSSSSPAGSSGPTVQGSSSPVAPGGPACCDALRGAAATAPVEDQSALLFASLECDRMVNEKTLSRKRLEALTGTLPLPRGCL